MPFNAKIQAEPVRQQRSFGERQYHVHNQRPIIYRFYIRGIYLLFIRIYSCIYIANFHGEMQKFCSKVFNFK